MPEPPQTQAPRREHPPNSRRDPALDGLRGLAILLIFLFHYGGGLRAHNPLVRTLGYLTQAGWTGVDLFFALSGFLITGVLADNLASPRTLRHFYARRALRILPLYLFALLAASSAALLTGATLLQLSPILVYTLFLQNLPPLLNTALHTPPPLPLHHLWSLAVEEQFYLLWPFALLAARTPRRALALCLWTFALSCLLRALVFAPHLLSDRNAGSFAVFLPTRAGALALGSALALYHRQNRQSFAEPITPALKPVLSTEAKRPVLSTEAQRSVISTEAQRSGETRSDRARAADTSPSPLQTLALLSAAAGLTAFLLTALHTHTLLLSTRPAFLLSLPAVDLLSAALVALTLEPNLFRTALSTPALGALGRLSYGFYVFHILLEPFVDRLGTLLTHSTSGFPYQTARLLTAFPLTLFAAWLSFRFLEQPFLRLKRRFPSSAAPVR